MGQLSPNHTLKNIGFAIGMIVLLAISFKLTGELNLDTNTPVVSQTDSMIQSFNTPTTNHD